MTNAFEILGISPGLTFSDDELCSAFREAAKMAHPDAGGYEAEFAIPLASLSLGPGDSLDFILFGDNTDSDLVPDAYGSSFLTYTVVPEPSAFLLGALGLTGFLRRKR